jgi:hypothetical protein
MQNHIEAFVSIAGTHLVLFNILSWHFASLKAFNRELYVIKNLINLSWIHKLHQTKAIAALLSGEMKDTVQLNPAGAYGLVVFFFRTSRTRKLTCSNLVLERFFSKRERKELFRSWVGSACMWIKVSLFFQLTYDILIYKHPREET